MSSVADIRMMGMLDGPIVVQILAEFLPENLHALVSARGRLPDPFGQPAIHFSVLHKFKQPLAGYREFKACKIEIVSKRRSSLMKFGLLSAVIVCSIPVHVPILSIAYNQRFESGPGSGVVVGF